ncbi:MAG: peptide chain release factor 2 [Actinobacteria bacterium]|nr:peptide chain release factor 2 [Actinomycetota bacterium]
MMLEEKKQKIASLLEKFYFLRDVFDIDNKKIKLAQLENLAASRNLWDNAAQAQEIIKSLNEIKNSFSMLAKLEDKIENAKIAIEILENEDDEALESELALNLKEISDTLNELEEEIILSEQYDSYPAVITLHPGAGGTESHDWVEMLLRMYKKWLDKKRFKYRIIDYLPGEEAGIKSVTLTIKGKNAYGLLKSEKGIHRLVRISPFDSSKRRHTSFASVDVIPLFEQDIDIEINKEDLRIDTFRSSSAGGQHVNVTDSAVRITHLPTNTVVSCQDERSQILNRQTAMIILKSKLYELEIKKKEEEINRVRGEKKDIGWGNQIRSYVLQPYQLVKDHRTGIEVGDVDSVLNGEIDIFIRGFLEKNLLKR